MSRLLTIFFLGLSVVWLASCGKSKPMSKENFSQAYDPAQVPLKLRHTVYHHSPEQSTIYIQIPSSDLTYSQPDESGLINATAIIDVKAYIMGSESKKAIDSLLVKVVDEQPAQTPFYINTNARLNLANGKVYEARLKITDRHGNIQMEETIVVDKQNLNSRQNFLLFDSNYEVPLHGAWVNEPTWLRIKNNESKKMHVRYYLRQFPLPPPPFSNFNPPPFQYEADSIFELNANSDFSVFKARKMGFYHVQKDESQKDGITVFAFSEHFPKVVTTEQMFESLRYITTEWEYREIKQSKNLKKELEKFWVNCAGNREKAGELIKIYYNRVEEANRFFSSFVEGWKTDRGLIHIVYGKPNIIYQSPTAETWIYGEDKNMMSLTFVFVKVINPFTDNDYRLSRDENFKASWYRSIESWRNGRIYAN